MQEGTPLVPIVSHFTRSPYKRLKATKYHRDGRVEKTNIKTPDARAGAKLKAALVAAKKLGPVKESTAFDINKFRPLANRVLLRQEFVTQEDGIDIPEGSQKEVQFPAVVVVGGKGVEFKAGDRVIFKCTARKKSVMLGEVRYWLAKANQVVGVAL